MEFKRLTVADRPDADPGGRDGRGARLEGAAPAFRRVLLKLSGEALMGRREYGVDPRTVEAIAGEIVDVQSEGLELAIVVGGGNIYRGMAAAAAAWIARPATTPACSRPS